jgi:hypothetical protein
MLCRTVPGSYHVHHFEKLVMHALPPTTTTTTTSNNNHLTLPTNQGKDVCYYYCSITHDVKQRRCTFWRCPPFFPAGCPLLATKKKMAKKTRTIHAKQKVANTTKKPSPPTKSPLKPPQETKETKCYAMIYAMVYWATCPLPYTYSMSPPFLEPFLPFHLIHHNQAGWPSNLHHHHNPRFHLTRHHNLYPCHAPVPKLNPHENKEAMNPWSPLVSSLLLSPLPKEVEKRTNKQPAKGSGKKSPAKQPTKGGAN